MVTLSRLVVVVSLQLFRFADSNPSWNMVSDDGGSVGGVGVDVGVVVGGGVGEESGVKTAFRVCVVPLFCVGMVT